MRLQTIDILALGAVAAMAAATLWVLAAGPTGPVPMQLGLDGTVNRWGTSGELAGAMALATIIAAATAAVLGWIERDPRSRAQAERAPAAFLVGRITALAAPGVAVAAMAALAFGGLRPGEDQTATVRLITGGVALVLFAIGAVLGKSAPNAFVGVRTPWSLSSRLAWDKSNRLAGRLLFWIGLAGMIAAAVGPFPATLFILVVAVVGAMLAAVLESWRVWRSDSARDA